jgi:hypothetical protein
MRCGDSVMGDDGEMRDYRYEDTLCFASVRRPATLVTPSFLFWNNCGANLNNPTGQVVEKSLLSTRETRE